jgi:hypothetical protein
MSFIKCGLLWDIELCYIIIQYNWLVDIKCFKQYLLNYLEMWYFKRPTKGANFVVIVIVVNMN